MNKKQYRSVLLGDVKLGDFCLIWGKNGSKQVMVQITGKDTKSGKVHMSDSTGLVLEAKPDMKVLIPSHLTK